MSPCSWSITWDLEQGRECFINDLIVTEGCQLCAAVWNLLTADHGQRKGRKKIPRFR